MNRWGVWRLRDGGIAIRCPYGELRIYFERHGPVKWRPVETEKRM